MQHYVEKKTIQVYGWQPSEGINFGDEIGFDIVRKLADHYKSEAVVVRCSQPGPNKLLAVGSIIQMAGYGDVIWGSGVNGKTWIPSSISKLNLNVTSVRGPISRMALVQNGVDCPEVYGDPGLLYPILFSNEIIRERNFLLSYFQLMNMEIPKKIFIPNLNDLKFYCPEIEKLRDIYLVRPSSSAARVAAYISLADEVYSSSLHGIVFSDVLGKPVQMVPSRFEALLKYDDYFMGTGRDPVQPAEISSSFTTNVVPLNYEYTSLLEAFPIRPGRRLKESLIIETINKDILSFIKINDNDPTISIDRIGGIDVLGGGSVISFRVPNNSITRKNDLKFLVRATARGLGTRNIQSSVNGVRTKCVATLSDKGVTVKIELPEKSTANDFLVKVNFSMTPEGGKGNKCELPSQYFLVFDCPTIGERADGL